MCPNENETSPEKAPPNRGPELLLGSPRRPRGHPIVPRGSHHPPRRSVRHPYRTALDHFANHFGPFIRDKFRCGFRSKFSTSSIYCEEAMSTPNLLLKSSPYQIRCGGSGNTRLPHKLRDFLYLHTAEICFGLLWASNRQVSASA